VLLNSVVYRLNKEMLPHSLSSDFAWQTVKELRRIWFVLLNSIVYRPNKEMLTDS
jgi:hypothetical protein